MATSPAYSATPRNSAGLVATGDASRTAPTNKTTIFAAGASGSRIERITCAAVGATISSMLRLFIFDGTTYWLYLEIPVQAITPSGTQQVWSTTIEAWTTPNLIPILLKSGSSLVASINDTQAGGGVAVIAMGGDF